jgi:tetratricopeptide (TPR) repeat protein
MKEREIFDAALAIADPVERDAFLDAACGNDSRLVEHLRGLLEAQRRLSGFLETPAFSPAVAETAALASLSAEGPGVVVGRYKLLEQIGEGGMGTVFMAEQTDPVRRKVALKVIKSGMDTRQVVARFEAERQALALMDHPNIARVLDAGASGSGRPFFVMELVRGVPITNYCDRVNLPIAARLGLFVQVCQAVQHAHQKGIIHRDLKPSNVLVTLHDGVPVPKVIDFGVAKATGQQLTDKTLFTGFLQLVGTPLYMSPEQAGMSGLDVDTRSDVYSLGVLLYELLTGTTPFDPETLRKAAFEEVRRIIREEEPPKPSTRLSSLGETLTSVSAKRGSDPRWLGKAVSGELDWIVMKALEKDRNRRYVTANEFADDVKRFLADRPVEARPPSATYLVRKFAGRNRTALLVGLVVALSLLTAFVVGVVQEFRAREAASIALEERRRSESEIAISQAVMKFLTDDMIRPAYPMYQEKGLRGEGDPGIKLRTALDWAARKVHERFAEKPLVEAAVRHAISDMYGQLGEPGEAERHETECLEVRRAWLTAGDPALTSSVLSLAEINQDLGRCDKSLALIEAEAEALRRVKGVHSTEYLNFAFSACHILVTCKYYPACVRIAESALPGARTRFGLAEHKTRGLLTSLCVAYRGEGKPGDAERLLNEVIDDAQRENLPVVNDLREQLARHYQARKDYARAEKALLPVLESERRGKGQAAPRGTHSQKVLAEIYLDAGRFDEAAEILRDDVEARRAQYGDKSPFVTGIGTSWLARAYEGQGRFKEAEALRIEAIANLRRLFEPNNGMTLSVVNSLAWSYLKQGEPSKAQSLLEEILAEPEEHPSWRRAETSVLLGRSLSAQGRFEQAETQLLKAYEDYQSVTGDPWADQNVAVEAIVDLYVAWERPQQAAEWKAKLRPATLPARP